MDPEQALRDAAAHLAAGELIEVAETLAAYWGWRHGGGFEPKDGDALARRLRRRLVQRQRHQDEEGGPIPLGECLDEWEAHRRDSPSDGDSAESNG